MNYKNHAIYYYDTVRDTSNDRSPSYEGERIKSNHSGYQHLGSENFEHDETGEIMNYSGVEDMIFSSIAEHEDWTEGYDY